MDRRREGSTAHMLYIIRGCEQNITNPKPNAFCLFVCLLRLRSLKSNEQGTLGTEDALQINYTALAIAVNAGEGVPVQQVLFVAHASRTVIIMTSH